MKKVFSLFVFVALLVSCKEEENPGAAVYAKAIELSTDRLFVQKGTYEILKVKFSPSNVTERDMTWVSLNPAVFSVDDGIVIGLSIGSAELIAKCGDATARCKVTVTLNPTVNGYEFVEMGDGLKWATCNMEGEAPHSYGEYFAWGETEVKSEYNWESYEWVQKDQADENHISKYSRKDDVKTGIWYDGDNFKGDKGDGKEYLDYASYGFVDDPAHVNWGFPWRTPTVGEWEVLMDTEKFTWTWTANYDDTGIKGVIVTSKIKGYEGNRIFIPAAGFRTQKDIVGQNSECTYWSSSLSTVSSAKGWSLYTTGSLPSGADNYRYIGTPVRPVSE